MLAVSLGELGVTEIAIVFAALAYVAQITLDATGRSRSSRMLRVENEDLIRRNTELEGKIAGLNTRVAELMTEVSALRVQVGELSQRDQAAVLAAIEHHEAAAGARHERMVGVLTEIRDAVKAA